MNLIARYMVAFLGNAYKDYRSQVFFCSQLLRYFSTCTIRNVEFVCLHFLFCRLDLNSIVTAICNRKEMIQRILKVVWSHYRFLFLFFPLEVFPRASFSEIKLDGIFTKLSYFLRIRLLSCPNGRKVDSFE